MKFQKLPFSSHAKMNWNFQFITVPLVKCLLMRPNMMAFIVSRSCNLFKQADRRQFLKNCYNQLRKDGIMVFIVVSKGYKKLYGNGKLVNNDRFWTEKGLTVFFYDSVSIEKEFAPFGLVEYREIDEPVKHLENEEPMKFFQVVCRKK